MPKRGQRPSREQHRILPRYDLPADLAFALKPIGVVRSPYVWREDAPRQATVGTARKGTIVLRPGLQNTLKDLEGFDRLWVLFAFHHSHGWKQQLIPPRDTVKRGVFATRSPDRPNPVGLSCVRLVRIYGVRIDVLGLDLLDGTPVLDLKPYVAAYDAFPDAKAGYVDDLRDDAPDHRHS